MKKIKNSIFASLLLSIFLISSGEKETRELTTSTFPSDIAFSMEVDNQEWKPLSLSYLSYYMESETGEDSYIVTVAAHLKDKASNEGDPSQESLHFTFNIPASKIEDAAGTYEIEEVKKSENETVYTGLVHFNAKDGQKYMPNYKINPKVGTITLTKTEFGDQGKIGDFPIGNGLKHIEGTFEFSLYLKDDQSSKNMKISKGSFSLKTGEW